MKEQTVPPRKSLPPSIAEVAFDCPHCGAYTTHSWFALYAERIRGEQRTPSRPNPDLPEVIGHQKELKAEQRKSLIKFAEKWIGGQVFLENMGTGKHLDSQIYNLNLSQCFACNQIAVWVDDRLSNPVAGQAPPPNADLPLEVRHDYVEASRILELSPRGSAALLRLSIQKLCVSLGEKGKNIDDDIASLVKKGLAPLVQKALDALRVIGNEAVHPGTLDLKDDRDTASGLFGLVNIIAEQLISNPRHVTDLYAKIPESKRTAIEKRDGKP